MIPGIHVMTRRDLLLTTAFAASVETPGTTSHGIARPLIRSARLGAQIRLAGSGGDTWIAAWADDDNLYVTSDDTSGFNNACGKSASNLAVNRVDGTMPPQASRRDGQLHEGIRPGFRDQAGRRRHVEGVWDYVCRWRPLYGS